ncbi:TOBE domain-containing protein [Phytohabitans flavus]|uniref:TOBE domain-containing protein n=1 Tax=Phytohabitans flavus TaxID=1076124 RepID=UPI00156661E2|nr:TOBE domain-containing protein [Phytohabitans flavus]
MLVTHDQAEAMTLASRVALLRDGVIRQHGTPRDLYLCPADHDVAAFVGDVTVLPATFRGDTADTPLGPVALRTRHDGEGLVLVRPEQLQPSVGGVEALVAAVEFQGTSGLVHLARAGDRYTARWTAHLLAAPGTTVRVRVHGPAVLVTDTASPDAVRSAAGPVRQDSNR